MFLPGIFSVNTHSSNECSKIKEHSMYQKSSPNRCEHTQYKEKVLNNNENLKNLYNDDNLLPNIIVNHSVQHLSNPPPPLYRSSPPLKSERPTPPNGQPPH